MAHHATLRHHRLQLRIAHGFRHGNGLCRCGPEPDDQRQQHSHAHRRIGPGMAVAAELETMAQHKKLADGRTGEHHGDQHQPVLRVAVGEAVVVAEHGEQHRQGEVGVVHAALLAALAMDGVDRLAGLQVGHHRSLAGNDPEKHVGAHGGGDHGPHQQKGGAAGEHVGRRVGRHADQQQHQRTDLGIAVPALPQGPADRVVQQPEHHQERQGGGDGAGRAPGHDIRVDQVDAGTPEVRDQEERKAREPGGIALPVEPVEMLGQLGRRDREFHGVVEPAAVHRPELTADAVFFQLLVFGRREAAVEENEIKRRADPGDGDDHMQPANQQVAPVKQIGFHGTST